jgi:hypothetical protein
MIRRLSVATAFVAALGAGALFSPTASARDVAWSVSIGAPGVAVSAGYPYWGYRPYYRPYRVRPRVVYRAPVVYDPYPYVYPAPVVVRPAPYYYGPRRAYWRY